MAEIKISDEAVEILARRLSESFFVNPPRSAEHLESRWTEMLIESERNRYRQAAREHLEAAYPLLRQQWETEFLESLKKHGGDQWLEGYEAGCSMSHSLGCDAVEAQRDHLVAENARLSAVVAEAIVRDILANRQHATPEQVAALEAAAAVARAVGARAGRPNGTEAPDA